MTRSFARRIVLAAALLVFTSVPTFAQNHLFDLRPGDINSDGDVTLVTLIYNGLFSDGRFIFEAVHLRIPGLNVFDDYNELSVGGGVRVVRKGGLRLYALGHIAFSSDDARFLQPAVMMQFASGRWAASSFVQRYVAISDSANSAWLIDPAELQYRVAGPVSIGASAYMFRPDGSSTLLKVGPKVSVADKYGTTELRVAHVNQGASIEYQIRRIFTF